MVLGAFMACVAGIPASAADVHVHGVATMQVVVEDAAVRIDLYSPAHDILGFEHGPRTAGERKRAVEARRQLQRPWYRVPVAAGCRLTSATTVLPGDAPATDAHAGRDPLHRHVHGHLHGHRHGNARDPGPANSDGAGGEHAEVTASHLLSCRAPAMLTVLDVHLFDRHPGLTEVRVQYVRASSQGERRTSTRARRVELGGG